MQPRTETKIVLVIRPSRLAELVGRFNTVAQARFYVEHLGADFTDYEREDARYGEALRQAKQRIAEWGRIQVLERRFLPNFIFGPQDVIVALGQDGLVANTLKYLDGQPLIGVNPDPQRWDGQLLPFRVEDLTALMPEVLAGRRSTRAVTLAQARLNNGQSLCAVNDHPWFGSLPHPDWRCRRGSFLEWCHRLDRLGLDRLAAKPVGRRHSDQPQRPGGLLRIEHVRGGWNNCPRAGPPRAG